MNKRKRELLAALLLGVIAPGVIISGAEAPAQEEMNYIETAPTLQTEAPAVRQEITITVLSDGIPVDMVLDDYLTGVVLAEMPASFDMQSKKAQAVAARTVTLRLAERGGKHENAVVCTDSTCCQAYTSPVDFLEMGGVQESVDLARLAVAETTDQVIVYDGELIDATYFSCSGGRTEDAVAVWGSEVPYLQAVDSPGEESAVHYEDEVTFTASAFQQKLGVLLTGSCASWFGEVTYTDGGGVQTIVIGAMEYTGIQLRKLLGLRSTAFTVHVFGDSITIKTSGFGHRVGMSQYGAEAMALAGSSYEEILAHYYTGTSLIIYKTVED